MVRDAHNSLCGARATIGRYFAEKGGNGQLVASINSANEFAQVRISCR